MMRRPDLARSRWMLSQPLRTACRASVGLLMLLMPLAASAQAQYPSFGLPSSAYRTPPVRKLNRPQRTAQRIAEPAPVASAQRTDEPTVAAAPRAAEGGQAAGPHSDDGPPSVRQRPFIDPAALFSAQQTRQRALSAIRRAALTAQTGNEKPRHQPPERNPRYLIPPTVSHSQQSDDRARATTRSAIPTAQNEPHGEPSRQLPEEQPRVLDRTTVSKAQRMEDRAVSARPPAEWNRNDYRREYTLNVYMTQPRSRETGPSLSDAEAPRPVVANLGAERFQQPVHRGYDKELLLAYLESPAPRIATLADYSSVRSAPTAQPQQSPPRHVAAVRPADGRTPTRKSINAHHRKRAVASGVQLPFPPFTPGPCYRRTTKSLGRRIVLSTSTGPQKRKPVQVPRTTMLTTSTGSQKRNSVNVFRTSMLSGAGSKRRGFGMPAPGSQKRSAPFDPDGWMFAESESDSDNVSQADAFSAKTPKPLAQVMTAALPSFVKRSTEMYTALSAVTQHGDYFGESVKTSTRLTPSPSQIISARIESVRAAADDDQNSVQPPPAASHGTHVASSDRDGRDTPGVASPVTRVIERKASEAGPSSTAQAADSRAGECPFLNGECQRHRRPDDDRPPAPQTHNDSAFQLPRLPPQTLSAVSRTAATEIDAPPARFVTPRLTIGSVARDAETSHRTTPRPLDEDFQLPVLLPSAPLRTSGSTAREQTDPLTSTTPDSAPMWGGAYSGSMFPFLPGQAFVEGERFVNPDERIEIDTDALTGPSLRPSGTDAQATAASSGRPMPLMQGTRMQQIVSRDGAGLKGFCPVTLRDQRALADGKADFASRYQGRIYYLSSAAAQAAFERDPAKYAPAARDVALAAVTGKNQQGSLDHAVWYRDRLYLFTSAESLKTFTAAPHAMAVAELCGSDHFQLDGHICCRCRY